MSVRKVKDNIYEVGAVDWDRRLFDELIPLPDGTSYNAYLIRGQNHTALLDTVDPTKAQELLAHLEELEVKRLDYLVSHHAEQDHSGSIPAVLARYPEAQLVTNEKCRGLLIDLLHVPAERFRVVGDGETLALGGKTLEFILAPWVHWPETMFSYLREERILFTCDFLGSHLAQSELFLVDEPRTHAAAKRYYAEIMMPFRTNIQKHLERIQKLAIDTIAPSHGVVYPKPAFILDAYRDWVSERVANKVLIPFVSMHGSTRRMVEHLVAELSGRNIPVLPFNLTRGDIGELALELVDTATLIIATPAVLAGAHPEVVLAAYLTNALRPKVKVAAIIGSYGWGSRLLESLQAMLGNLKVDMLEPVLVKGFPRPQDLQALDRLADRIVEKHRSLGLL